MNCAALLAQIFKEDEKAGPIAPYVSKTRGTNWLLICAALAPYFLILVASLCLAKYNGEHIAGRVGLGCEIIGWVIVTSAKIGAKSPDVIVRSILPFPEVSKSLKGPSEDKGTSC